MNKRFFLPVLHGDHLQIQSSKIRQHNDANILAMPARFITLETALGIVDVFLNTEFEGGRHATRVGKIACS